MHMKKILSAIILILSMGACVSEYIAVEEIATPENQRRGLTKSALSFENADSLMLIYKRQTDPELRMLDMIYYRDSTFHIVINEEESEELGISGDIYRKYKTLVTTLNNQ